MAFPATEPVAELIIQNIEAALLTISPQNSTTDYWNKIRSVHRHDVGYPTLSSYPSIVLMMGNKTISDELDAHEYSLNTEELNIRMDIWLEQTSDAALQMQRIERDVRTALMLDPRRTTSGTELAVHTHITGATYNYAADLSQPNALVELDVTIKFRTRVDSLESVA